MSEAAKRVPPRLAHPVGLRSLQRMWQPARFVAFYAKLFPSWTWTPATERYPEEHIALFRFGGSDGQGGGIVKVPAECKTGDLKRGMGVTIYHMVENIEETEKQVVELGGMAVTEKEPESDSGWHMSFKDVEGNRFGVYQMRK